MSDDSLPLENAHKHKNVFPLAMAEIASRRAVVGLGRRRVSAAWLTGHGRVQSVKQIKIQRSFRLVNCRVEMNNHRLWAVMRSYCHSCHHFDSLVSSFALFSAFLLVPCSFCVGLSHNVFEDRCSNFDVLGYSF